MRGLQLFLSFNGSDRESVIAVKRLLEARGIATFLDHDNLVPGLPWPPALEQAMKDVKAVGVFIGRELSEWQKREMWFALARQADEQKQGRAFPVIPVLLPGADLTPGFLFNNTWIDLRGGLDGVAAAEALDAFERAINSTQPAQAAERATVICPYRGLQVFREEDAAFFFGRKAFTDQLLEFSLGKDLVALVGPSGSGKSSVVYAGLIPLLRRERPPASTWDVVSFTPGKDPFHSLASQLIPLLEPHLTETDWLKEADKLRNALAGGEVKLEAVIKRVIEKSNGTGRLLLVADQFEELFTRAPESARQPFAQALLRALGNAPFTLLVTLRADFYSQIITLDRDLSDRLAPAQVNIGVLTPDELRESIAAPAKLVGLDFEPGLVERILTDVGSEPGRLPLVEFALTELWQRRDGHLLTNRAYDEIGGVTGALATKAEAEFAGFAPEEQAAARRLFSRLVRVARPQEGTEDTRQRAEIQATDVTTEKVAQALAGPDVRLLVMGRPEREGQTGGQTVELAHEALIGNWDRLRGWLNEDREFLLWRQRLQVHAADWQEHEQDAGYLLRGAPLSEAERWLLWRPQDLAEAEQQFVRDSVAVREREREAGERRKRRILAAIATIVVAIACGIGYWWDWNRVKTGYYADYALRWDVPFGIGVLSEETASHRSASYALDTRRGKVIAMRHMNGSFSLTALNGDGVDAEGWFKGVAEWRLSYRDDGRVGTITLWGPTGCLVLAEQYQFDAQGKTAAVMFQQAVGRSNALPGDISALTLLAGDKQPRKSEISQHRVYFDAAGFVSRRVFEDGWGNPAPDSLGSFGHAYEYSDLGQLTEIRNLRKDGTTLAEKTGVAQVRKSYAPSGDLVGVEWRDAKGSPVMTRQQGARKSLRLDRYGNVVEVAFYAPNGKLLQSREQSTYARETRRFDERGNQIQMAYFGDDGNPILNIERCARKTSRFDRRGNLIEEACIGKDGKPALSSEGFARKTMSYDDRGNEIDTSYFGIDGKPIVLKDRLNDMLEITKGFSRVTKRFNAHGDISEMAYFGPDGRLTLNPSGYARATARYDDQDRATEAAFFDTTGALTIIWGFWDGGYARLTAGHDERGNVTNLSFYGVDGKLTLRNCVSSSGYAQVAWRYDARGNQIEAAFFDTKGKPINPWGFFEHDSARVTWQYDEHGNQIDEAFFGTDGKPNLSRVDGYARKTTRYDEHDNKVEEFYFGADGKPISLRGDYASATWRYDERGNQTEEAYFGADGTPVLLKYGHYARKATDYDRQGNPINVAYFDTDGNLSLRVTTRFDDQGNAIETAYFGTNGKPLAYKDGAAKIVKAYDAKRRVTEIASTDAQGRPVLVDGIGAKALYAYDDSDRVVGVTYLDDRGREIATEVEVVKVIARTPAERIRLSAGDRLLTYQGERFTSGQRLAALTAQAGADTRLLTVRRGGKILSFQVPAGQLGVKFRNVRAAAKTGVASALLRR